MKIYSARLNVANFAPCSRADTVVVEETVLPRNISKYTQDSGLLLTPSPANAMKKEGIILIPQNEGSGSISEGEYLIFIHTCYAVLVNNLIISCQYLTFRQSSTSSVKCYYSWKKCKYWLSLHLFQRDRWSKELIKYYQGKSKSPNGLLIQVVLK